MAKVSFAAKDTYEPKLGFQEGWFEIVGAKTQVFQYPPNKDSGEQTQPFLAAVISFQKTDEQGAPLDEEPQERTLRVEKDLNKMRPGDASSREDEDPSDMGDELDTEGNCVFTEAGAKINHNSAWATFVRSLEDKGFKAEILGQGYLPDLIGTKGHAVAAKGEKRNINGRDVEPNYLIIDKLTIKPYEAKSAAARKPAGKAAASNTSAASNGNAKVNGAAKAPPPTAAAEGDAASTAASEILTELAVDLQGETRDAPKVYAMAYSRLMKNKGRNKTLDKAIQDLFKDRDWLAAQGSETGLYKIEGDVYTFGEAEVAATA